MAANVLGKLAPHYMTKRKLFNICLLSSLVLLSLQKKKSALFEVAEVVPVMTNNYEENILRGVRDSSYSLESSIELLQKDVVQLHAPRYQSMRRVSQRTILGAEMVGRRHLANMC